MKIDRAEVEALELLLKKGEFLKSAGVSSSMPVRVDLLRKLHRLALEVMDAPEVEMPSRRGPRFDGPTLTIGTAAAEKMGLAGQRVRLVRVGEE